MAFDPQDAVDFMHQVLDAEGTIRSDAVEDLRFRFGDQWPTEIQNSRELESRPCLVINETDSYCRQVTNNMRQQRPRIKVHPVDSVADKKVAEVITGLTRHIEVNSDADNAYDLAGEFQVTSGVGYWRVLTDYVREDSFDQDIYIDQIENPFSVYFDPNSTCPDGSDAEKCLVTDKLPLALFKRQYPGAEISNFTANGAGDVDPDWVSKEDVRIGEYFDVSLVSDHLLKLSSGNVLYKSQLPTDAEMYLRSQGLQIVGDRPSYRRSVNWYKCTAMDVLDKKAWPGRWIPIVPVYGVRVIIDGKRKCFGMVRNARDPQSMVNYWQTATTESIALAPKAKWLIAEGQDEGHEEEWARANLSAMPVLRYKQTDVDGKDAPPPQRLQPEPPPAGMIEAAMAASSNLQKAIGMFDPAIRAQGPKSGKAIRAEQQQADNSNFHFYDNLTRSMKHTGRIILDLIPKIYDTQRVMRIIGEDGKPDLVTINEPGQKEDETGQAINTVLNDVTVGQYDVVMETGPGYNSKREEAAETLTTLAQAYPRLMDVAGDIIFRNMDFPGADTIADRLAAANPLAQVDEKSDIPPKAQMMIKQLQQRLQDCEKALQDAQAEIKYRMSVEKMKQDGETKREHLRAAVKAHDTETWAQEERDQFESVERTKKHDTETRAYAMLSTAEIKVLGDLLVKHIETRQLEKQMAHEDAQLKAKSDQNEETIE